MKRIGGLKQQAAAGVSEVTVDGRTPAADRRRLAFIRDLDLAWCDLSSFSKSSHAAKSWSAVGRNCRQMTSLARQYYITNIFPLVTPLAMDPAHPFPFISNLSLNLLVSLASCRPPFGIGAGEGAGRSGVPVF